MCNNGRDLVIQRRVFPFAVVEHLGAFEDNLPREWAEAWPQVRADRNPEADRGSDYHPENSFRIEFQNFPDAACELLHFPSNTDFLTGLQWAPGRRLPLRVEVITR